jgi:hypothetical protein
MSSHSHNSCSRVAVLLLAVVVVLGCFGTFAVGQDQPAPKWDFTADTPLSIPAAMCTACFRAGFSQ